MNMAEMTEAISKKHGLSESLSNRILKTVLETIRKELKKGHPALNRNEVTGSGMVRLRNFGTFQARKSHGKIRAKFDDSKNFFSPCGRSTVGRK